MGYGLDITNQQLVGGDYLGQPKVVKVDKNGGLLIGGDNAGRTGLNTIFGDQVIAGKNDSISEKWDLGLISDDFNITTANGGTATESNSRLFLQTSTATNGQVIVETKDRVIYRPGHDMYGYFTYAWPEGGVAGCKNFIGTIDANNGYYVGYNETTFVIGRRIGGVDNETAQASWNLDKLDGTGPSGFVLDHTKMNIFRLNYGYLGIAPCYFEIKTGENSWVTFHATETLNSQTALAIESANLPIRAEITKTSGATNITGYSGSWNAGYYNGTTSFIGNKPHHYDTGTGQALTGTGVENVVIFHLKTTFNSKTNTVPARMVHADFNNDATGDIILAQIIANPTTVGGTAVASLSYTDIDTNNSTVEYSAGGGAVVGGKTIYAQYMVGGGGGSGAFSGGGTITAQELGLIGRPGDYFAVVYQRVSGTGAYNALMNINWIELF